MFSRSALGASVLLAFLSTAAAHLDMLSPKPITGNIGVKDPLAADGSNFPCHSSQLSGSVTDMTVGEQQTLAWDTADGFNTAVHGGGACQLSVSYETDSQKLKDPVSWKVIYSIKSGCPTNSLMNLDGVDPPSGFDGNFAGPSGGAYSGSYTCGDSRANDVDCVNKFTFTIPKGMKDGNAIFAWTWFNNIGNREMYMNCAAIKISGGDGSEVDSLPSMFVANLATVNGQDSTCGTTESNNVEFPDPGKYVTSKTAPQGSTLVGTVSGTVFTETFSNYPTAAPTGNCAVASGGSSGGAASTPAYSAPVNSGGNFAPGAASSTPAASTPAPAASSPAPVASTPAPVASSPAPVASSPAQVVSSPAGTAPVAGSTGGACANPCSEDGKVVCIGSSQFGLCNRGCAVAQDLAAGTTCKSGVISKRDGHVRRVPPQARHAHRRLHGASF